MKAKLLTGLLAAFTSMMAGVTHANELPPPPYIRFVLSPTEIRLPKLQAGQEYAVFTSMQPTGLYTALITTLNGMQLYANIPVHAGNCSSEDQHYWPDQLEGKLVDRRYEPESLPALDLPLAGTISLWLWCPTPRDDSDPTRNPTPGLPQST